MHIRAGVVEGGWEDVGEVGRWGGRLYCAQFYLLLVPGAPRLFPQLMHRLLVV